jgi:apolipoprotein N-acyltransferase
MIAVLCVALSALGLYFCMGLADHWWLAWVAPIPVLWLAFDLTRGWLLVSAGALLAFVLGEANLLWAYGGTIPVPVLVLAIGGPALLFATAVLGARSVYSRLGSAAAGSIAAMITFATLWAGLDFVSSFNHAGGSISTPAAAEMSAPVLIQSASLVGFTGITFLLGLFAAGIALSLRTRSPLPAAVAIALFVANAASGYLRISTPPAGSIRVALMDSNDTIGTFRKDDKDVTFKAIDAYVAEIGKLQGQQIGLIVLPENISRLGAEWREEAGAKLAAAAKSVNATLVAGFDTPIDGAQRNISWAFVPDAAESVIYQKRRLVPVLESAIYTPGTGPRALANGIGLEICKDMDFHAMIRTDIVSTKPVLLAVPAWDFVRDDWAHARVAVLRSVENGVPMARTARDGLLTLNDRYGRLVAVTRTVGGFKTLVGDLPLDGHGGETLYDSIGDVFGWLCLAVGTALVGISFVRGHAVADRM